MDGRLVEGRLLRLDAGAETLVVEDGTRDPGQVLGFADVRSLELVDPVPASTDILPPAAAQGGRGAPGTVSPFRIEFSDGERLEGTTRGALADDASLHLFPPVEGDRVRRLFVPRAVVHRYSIGPRIGEALVERNVISEQDLESAVMEQKRRRSKRLGEYLLERSILSAEQLEKALQTRPDERGMKLGEFLVSEGLITREQLGEVLRAQQHDRNTRLGEILVEADPATYEAVSAVLAEKLEVPYVKLRNMDIDPQALFTVPEDVARRLQVMPLMIHGERIVVACSDPANDDVYKVLRFATQRNVEFVVAESTDIDWAIEKYYGLAEAGGDIEAVEGEAETDEDADLEDVQRLGSDSPIVRLVNRIIVDAVRKRASDIHLRPGERSVEILYRVDGSLIDVVSFGRSVLAQMVARVKVVASMDIAEHRLPQDGRARVLHDGRPVDLRISTIPTVHGESVVIRILDQSQRVAALSDVGFRPADLDRLRALLDRSFGLVLVTGPTGSGKSSTLYSCLEQVREQNVNVITVEDPVEFRMAGVEQVQVKESIGFTFARALRNILRHDPDVIMIGEIRDQQTARIAVESALTGHLVLSTLHTNAAVPTIYRLTDMGVEPYLVASGVSGVLAQRLIRLNCRHCRQEEEIGAKIRSRLGVSEAEIFYRGRGCDRCNGTGSSGRRVVYELLTMTRELRQLTASGAPEAKLQAQALDDGLIPLTTHALELARKGITSLAEVYRTRLD